MLVNDVEGSVSQFSGTSSPDFSGSKNLKSVQLRWNEVSCRCSYMENNCSVERQIFLFVVSVMFEIGEL